jgi:hypothetical protein
MEQDKELSSQESLALITQMIGRAKRDYLDTGLSSLLWGSVIPVCSLTVFVGVRLNMPVLNNVWFLTIFAAIAQGIIATREARARKHKSHDGELMGGLWLAFAVTMFLMGFVFGLYPSPGEAAIYLAVYGVPTFATGYGRRFMPMLVGGIFCWVLALVSLRVGYPNTMLCVAAGALGAWFIPGLILRKRYLKAKEQHV